MDDLERVRAALERVVKARTEVVSRAVWDEILRAGGKPTRLDQPLGPYLGVQGNPGFQFAVASGGSYTEERGGEAGFHHLRRDKRDPVPFNLDSHVVIEDLVGDRRWGDVLRVAGMEDTPDLVTLVRAHVFGYARNREKDHWCAEVPEDIAGATPKETGRDDHA